MPLAHIDIQLLVQALVNGLTLGCFIAMMSIGLIIVFGVLNIVNFAHGEFFMFGAFVVFFGRKIGIPFWLLLPASFILVGCLGAGVSHLVFNRFRGKLLSGAVAAIALSSIMQNGAWQVVGGEHIAVTQPLTGVVDISGVRVGTYRIFIIAATLIILALLYVFFTFTWHGRAVRALEQNSYSAELLGVRVAPTAALGFAVGVGLAGLAGAIMVPLQELSPGMGFLPLLWGFVVVILGGSGRYLGALLGALAIGIQQSFTITYWRGDMTILISFVFVILVVLMRRATRPGAY